MSGHSALNDGAGAATAGGAHNIYTYTVAGSAKWKKKTSSGCGRAQIYESHWSLKNEKTSTS